MSNLTTEYKLKSAAIDVMMETMEIDDLEIYLQEKLGIEGEDSNQQFSQFFIEHCVKMLAEFMREGFPIQVRAIDMIMNPEFMNSIIDMLRTAMMTGFLYGIQHEKRFPSQ